MKFLRVAALVLAAVIAVFLIVGMFLSRQWNVEVTTVTKAQPAQIWPLVRDFRQWQKWTMAMPDTTYAYSDQQATVGAWMSWSGQRSKAKFTATEVTDAAFKFDEQMEADEVNAHGEITVAPEANGTRITWKDTGTLPPILGGWFRGIMETALTEHMRGSLQKLSGMAEATKVEAPVAPGVEKAMDAGVAQEVAAVDAGEAAAGDEGGGQMADGGSQPSTEDVVDAGAPAEQTTPAVEADAGP